MQDTLVSSCRSCIIDVDFVVTGGHLYLWCSVVELSLLHLGVGVCACVKLQHRIIVFNFTFQAEKYEEIGSAPPQWKHSSESVIFWDPRSEILVFSTTQMICSYYSLYTRRYAGLRVSCWPLPCGEKIVSSLKRYDWCRFACMDMRM